MDDPNDFYSLDAKFKLGDLVRFIGYHYTPDFFYIDEEDYELGVIIAVHDRTYYAPVYSVHWFKLKRVTDVVQDHLSKVIKEY
tara:strand:- start:159 stop:407 length:249 start_codon:yes stop_codon:yes gene_type:complete